MKLRAKLLVEGIVQGVGFRPFIHNLAKAYDLTGWVLNSSKGVIIEAEGEEVGVESFITDVKSKAPPLARIENINISFLPRKGYISFEIKHSLAREGEFVLVSPDISICPDCLRELFDPQDRRYEYPFINCTNCGPRFTIIKDIPYDRDKTTMDEFEMCPLCAEEYSDPTNRRYHAQPNACPVCGPWVSLVDRERKPISGKPKRKLFNLELYLKQKSPFNEAGRLLKEGYIIAVKGLGGFHLACDATNDMAVKSLRERKGRDDKPFALMCLDMETIERYCSVSDEERSLLENRSRPIVLLRKLDNIPISEYVAVNNNYLGIMLPYTPLHYLLLKSSPPALVMTSANISEEPLLKDNEEVIRRLSHIADYFLLHNRDIFSRCDDTVARVVNLSSSSQEMMIRRSRGYAPLPIGLGFELKEVLACGGELKNTVCLTKGRYAFLSQHIGDLKNYETLQYFEETIERFRRLFKINPKIIAYDLHPQYLSTRYALEQEDIELIGVQHHHAHLASCMADNGLNGLKERVIGVIYDGTGYGTDGQIWGGEFLVGDYRDFKRVAHLRYIPLPGGDSAIKKPYRVALSFLQEIWGRDYSTRLDIELLNRISRDESEFIARMIEVGLNTPLTSSCGRLFDAVSSLCGVRDTINYEGQAAIELEMIADPRISDSYRYGINEEEESWIVDTLPIIEEVIYDLNRGQPRSTISAKFHNTVAEFSLDLCKKIRDREGINKVVFSGGVFQNMFLSERMMRNFDKAGFEVYIHSQVPPNDGGISLGQAVIAQFKENL